jgi:hypothetical protein
VRTGFILQLQHFLYSVLRGELTLCVACLGLISCRETARNVLPNQDLKNPRHRRCLFRAHQDHSGPWGAHTPVAAMMMKMYPAMGLFLMMGGTML